MGSIKLALLIYALTELTMALIWLIKPGLPRLPGDIYLDKIGFKIYIPFASAIVISVLMTILSFTFFAI